MSIIRKHVKDPLLNKTNKVARPIALASIISFIHLLVVRSFLKPHMIIPNGNELESCYSVIDDDKTNIDEILSCLMIIIVPILMCTIYDLQKHNRGGSMEIILKPFIIKQDIIAMN